MFTRGWQFNRPPFLMLDGTDDTSGGGDGGDDNAPKFPANTPWKEMKPEEQAAYWQHQAQKHEKRVKAFGDYTPDKIRAIEQERDQLKTSGQSEAEKALDAAREEGRAEVRAGWNRDKATYALEKALQGRVPNAADLLGLDVTKFIVNGQVDEAAVKAWVDEHSEEAPKGTQQRRNPDNGQGNRGDAGGSGKSVAAGRDRFAERRNKSTTTTS